jgi:hypothetical protein
MSGLSQLAQWEITLFLFALAALAAVQLLSGDINVKGLLYGRIRGRKPGEDRYFSPERVQLLVFTLGAAFVYVSQVASNSHNGTLPTVPNSWLAILGGSNALYLGGKAITQFLGNRIPRRNTKSRKLDDGG